MDFDPTTLNTLSAEANRLARRTATTARPDTRYAASDTTGTVRIVLNSHGTPVQVRIGNSWRSAVGATRLGDAVCQAMTAATSIRFADLAGCDESGPTPAKEPGVVIGRTAGVPKDENPKPAQAPPRSAPGDPSTPESMAAIRDLLALLDGAEAELAAYNEALERKSSRQIVGHNRLHTVRVTVTAGTVSRVRFTPRWLEANHAPAIAEAVLEALVQAINIAAAQDVIDPASALGRIRELGRDPTALMRRIGLLAPDGRTP